MKRWKGYEKGVNLGGWFSQCDYSKDRFENFITEKDIENLAGWGIDHLRLPVDYNLVETEEGDYKEEGFAYIQRAIDWCRKYKLNMILDLHKTAGYSFDQGEQQTGFFEKEAYQERFYRLWEEFARRFAGDEKSIAFELLNEVTDEKTSDTWNRIALTCISRIRKIAPQIKILIGGYWNNSVKAVKDLPLPPDENIVYNFHSYDPLLFTHQGASWVEGMPEDFRMPYKQTMEQYKIAQKIDLPSSFIAPVQGSEYEGVLDEKYFEQLFAEAINVAEERNVMLYCGEYGVIEKADTKSTLEWYKDIHQVFEKHGIGRAAWSYKEMDFDLQGSHLDEIRQELIKYL